MSRLAYVRVSTADQNEARQIEAMKGHNIDKYYTEKISAKNTNRPQLQAMLDYAREGDTIFIHDFSRIARSTKDLIEIVENLEAKGISLISLKENLDTSTPTGRLMLTMIGAINEFERENLLERQREGIAIAKSKGKFKGRKAIEKPKNWEEVYNLYKTRKLSATESMERLNLKRNTFYKFVSEESEAN